MYIFSRTTVAALGKQPEAMTAAVEIAAKVKQITDQDVNVFTVQFGAPMGTIMWSSINESQAALQDVAGKLAGDPGYLQDVAAISGLFMSPPEDRLSRVLTAPIEPTSRFYGITRAVMANGKYVEAIDFGMKMADYVGGALGMPSAFTKPAYGGYADVSWLLGLDTAADLDRFADWQMADTGYQERVTAAADLFVEGSGMTSLIEKLT